MNYTRLTNTAARLLKDYGQPCVLTHRVTGAYDPATSVATITSSDQEVSGVKLEYTTTKGSGNLNFSSDVVGIRDYQLLLAANTTSGETLIPPSVNDSVTLGSIKYTIQEVKVLAPSTTDILYTLRIR